MPHSSYFILFLAGIASASAFAQSSQSRTRAVSDAAMPTLAALEHNTDNGVKYACGGFGADEVALLKKAASRYDLMMTFAASSGAYLADVDVAIADARGRPVLDVTCDGPIMLIDLPHDGNYRVRAEAAGKTLTRSAEVRNKGDVQHLRLAWPTQLVDAGHASSTMRTQASGDSGSAGAAHSGKDHPAASASH